MATQIYPNPAMWTLDLVANLESEPYLSGRDSSLQVLNHRAEDQFRQFQAVNLGTADAITPPLESSPGDPWEVRGDTPHQRRSLACQRSFLAISALVTPRQHI